jgi:hypothetical protein
MDTEFLKYIPVYLMSMLKFIAGPTMGAAMGLTFEETVIITVLGMMTTVLLVTFLGKGLRHWMMSKLRKKNQKVFTKRNRRFVYIWKNYGLFGVSFLTPIIFSPVIGSLLVTTLGSPRKKIITYMLISALFWSLAFSKFIFLFNFK